MKATTNLVCLAAVACGLMPLQAQDKPITYDVKIHIGLTAGDLQKTHYDNKLIGFAAAAAYSLGGNRKVIGEVGFDYVPGRGRDTMPTSGAIYHNPGAPSSQYNGSALWLHPSNSVDHRKEGFQGFSLRGGYSDKLPFLEGVVWFAGLSLDRYKVTSEFLGTLNPVYGTPASFKTVSASTYEGWSFQKQSSKLGMGFFAGVGMVLNPNLRTEFTLRNIGAATFDHRPFTYTGKPAETRESTVRGWVFELGLALKI